MPDPVVKPILPQPINGQPSGLKINKKIITRKTILWICGLVLAIIIGIIASAIIWYNVQLSAVGSDAGLLEKITIPSGSTSSQIGKQLEQMSVIRSATIFDIYLRLSGKNNNLKAGTYRLSPSESIPQIVDHLLKGSTDQITLTFFPGATLVDNTSNTKKYEKKYDVTTVLKNAGYSTKEITAALNAQYDSPLFAGKPADAGLEGYIYGETYNFSTGATVQDILKRTFDEFYKVVQDNNLVAAFKKHGLTLYKGITLASIVQREASKPADQQQVAQVFYSRLDIGMTLGSDVTYQYIADKTGVARDPNLNSPYNTRRFTGLPPGPIAVPGLTALQAVAKPASGDYLFFLSGDDGAMYYARTEAEHNTNILSHCQVNCSTP